MRILFIPCYYGGLPRDAGSARVRAEWVARHWDGAEVYDGSQRLPGYGLYVFQKAYLNARARRWLLTAARWRDAGKCLLAFDLCDPDFLDPLHERRLSEVLPSFDFAVAPTGPLREWLARWLPAYLVPDRVDLDEAGEIGRAAARNTPTPSLVWAGYEGNVGALDALWPTIHALSLPVQILSKTKPIPFRDFWREILEHHDVLLNPRPDVPPYSYKSDNKTLIAWAMGMPVARTEQELRRLCDPRERRLESLARWAEVRADHDVRLSVEEWKAIVEKESR